MVIFSSCNGQNYDGIFEKESTQEHTANEPKYKDVEIVDSGYTLSKDGDYINWGVIFKNPDHQAIYEFTTISITSYDKEGSVLSTDNQVFNIIMPGETQTFGSSLSTNGEKPNRVEFTIESGNMITSADEHIASSKFKTRGLKDRKDEYGEVAFTGKVKNNSSINCDSACISIILKKKNRIVYGVNSFINNINAGQEKPFDISEYDLPKYDSYTITVIDWS